MAMEGMGPFQISKILTQEKIKKPSYHFATHILSGDKTTTRDLSNPCAWIGSTVSSILSRLEYAGHTVNFRTYKESYKDKNYKYNPKEEWKVFRNTHEPIIEQETFNTVQKLRGTPRRVDSIGVANPLTGLVFCNDCKAKMYNSRSSKEYYEVKVGSKIRRQKTTDHYTCSTHSLGKRIHTDNCSAHYIRTAVIREIILDAIRHICGYVRENEAEFAEKLRADSAVQQADTAKAHKQQLAKNERRIMELDVLFHRVYEDNTMGKISDERFELLSTGYEREQAELKEQTAVLKSELDAFEQDSMNAGRFLELVRRYTVLDELTTPMLNEFVHKVVVYEADKSSGERVQQVDVYLNFVGKFIIPGNEPKPLTPEEQAAEDERLAKKRKKNEYLRNWRKKKKAEREQPERKTA